MKRLTAAAILTLALPIAAYAAYDLEGAQLAAQLGDVLASEELCGLSYSQDEITDFVRSKVPANDMAFPGRLRMETRLAETSNKRLSPSSKTAHCTQIRRAAESYGFTN